MSGKEISLLITSLAISISEKVSSKDLDILSAAFTQLGDTLNTISVTEDVTNN